MSRDLSGRTALVTGGRTKLGHQIVLKLLRAHCTVVATTRHPEKALDIFRQYPDFDQFKLFVRPLDLDVPDLKEKLSELATFLAFKFDHLDILVNCAAQTIRCREKLIEQPSSDDLDTAQNRYGDTANVPETYKNSWGMTLEDMTQQEMEEVYRINAVAPVLLIQACLELLKRSSEPYVINVHAREGIFGGFKTHKHMHTNMAKAALAMATRTLWADKRSKLRIHGCDPGWISVDEYYEEGAPWIVPPLDERDGAARILFPVWRRYRGHWKTRKHYDFLVY
jgi:NAD(P)-dependent dehydrogenase (short-subunit alcohol dehydrogenase family)